MDAVLTENTDTPYHHAIRDFAAGRLRRGALDKYQDILDQNAQGPSRLAGPCHEL